MYVYNEFILIMHVYIHIHTFLTIVLGGLSFVVLFCRGVDRNKGIETIAKAVNKRSLHSEGA